MEKIIIKWIKRKEKEEKIHEDKVKQATNYYQ